MAKMILLLFVVPAVLAASVADSKPSSSAQNHLHKKPSEGKQANSVAGGPHPNPERVAFHTLDSGRDFNFNRNRHLVGDHLIGNQHLTTGLGGQHSLFVSPHTTASFPGVHQGVLTPNHLSGFGASRFPVSHRGGPYLVVPRHRGVQFGNSFGNSFGYSPNLIYLGNGLYGVGNYNTLGGNNFGQGIYPFSNHGGLGLQHGGFNRNFGALGNTGFHHNHLQRPTIGLTDGTFLAHNAIDDNTLLNTHTFGDRLGNPTIHTDPHKTAIRFGREE